MERVKKFLKIYYGAVVVIIVIETIVYSIMGIVATPESDLSELIKSLNNNDVSKIEMVDRKITAELESGETIVTYAASANMAETLVEKYALPSSERGDLTISSSSPGKQVPIVIRMLPTLISFSLTISLILVVMSQMGGMGLGGNKAKLRNQNDNSVKFRNVAGLDEEKEELAEIVDFLKNPKKYSKIGARMPKGVLLVGPPGTGKTYLSKATAGEAGVPFYTISGSDFVEMFVGLGAARVRNMFAEAKKNAPCIIFIDEIDAVGKARGSGNLGTEESDQTLNQLLVEMDGFDEDTGIIILAATNRDDILDPALLRPGRFDRKIFIGLPDVKAREDIFRIHLENKKLGAKVDPEILAKRTPGFSPADIENMLNEAAILSARHNQDAITMDIAEEAITKVILGSEKRSRVISDKERKLTAYHEAGHALVAKMLPDMPQVHQVTIIPRGRAGGFTMLLPDEDRLYATKASMKNDIIHLLAGRVAEKHALGDISTGAGSDIHRATEIARSMVMDYGFSEKLGMISYKETLESRFVRGHSEEVAKEIDAEVKSIVDDAFKSAENIILANMDKLHLIANKLLDVETLDADQFEELFTKN